MATSWKLPGSLYRIPDRSTDEDIDFKREDGETEDKKGRRGKRHELRY